jgi:hypothetical protein
LGLAGLIDILSGVPRRAAIAFAVAFVALALVPGAHALETSATAGAGASIPGAGRDWANPQFITADDTNFSVTAALNNNGDVSDRLYGSSFGLSVPAGATITGIQLDVMRASSRASVRDVEVLLTKGGVVVGENRAKPATELWPFPVTAMAIATYGGPTDLWGTTWTPAEVNDPDGIGAALSVVRADTNVVTASVDYFRLTVTYTLPATTFTITSSAGPGGNIAPLGSTAVTSGGSQAYAISPDPGYHVADVLVDGSSVGPVTTYAFTDVTADHTISASFAPDAYTLTYTAGPGGFISGTTPQAVC